MPEVQMKRCYPTLRFRSVGDADSERDIHHIALIGEERL